MALDQPPLASNADELFNRIGRNLLNYQRIETLLKFVVANSRWSGAVSKLESARATTVQAIYRTTLGVLSGKLDDMLADAGDPPEPAEIAEAHVSFRVQWELSMGHDELIDQLESVVRDRNDLVHHLGARWDRTSEASTRELVKELEGQLDTLRPVADRLSAMARALDEGIQAHAEYLGSAAGAAALELLFLQNSPIVRLMASCADALADSEGWTGLSAAAHVARRELPEDSSSLKRRYGHSTLKRVLVASELFEWRDVPTERGYRCEYRRRLPGD